MSSLMGCDIEGSGTFYYIGIVTYSSLVVVDEALYWHVLLDFLWFSSS